jgi:hypothetical protein
MHTTMGQLTFCTNIFPGETWEEHFAALKKNIPVIRQQLSSGKPFGIGLRLSNKASLQLSKEESLGEFRKWLSENDCYIFTMNGFPYGNFHHSRVKDLVHAPDWTTNDRLQYTLRLFRILAALLPAGMDGGVSTSPLSYKHWWDNDLLSVSSAADTCTWNIIQVVEQLYHVYQSTGKMLHLDIEPEADGLIENSDEFINWYLYKLLPVGVSVLQDKFSLSNEEAEKTIRDHVRLCYDVCHFAVGYEDQDEVLQKLQDAGISVGKWQLSSALKISLAGTPEEKQAILQELKKFDEPVYLHQVVVQENDGALLHYPDLSDALKDTKAMQAKEWRSHFHVPLFIKEYGLLGSTQAEVIKALRLQAKKNITGHIEIETYTWDVLPDKLKLPLSESILREIKWVIDQMI